MGTKKNLVNIGDIIQLIPLFVHFMHLSFPCFIVIIIVKPKSWSSNLPWELMKVSPWERYYLFQLILELYVLQLAIFHLLYFHVLQMTCTSQAPPQLYHLHISTSKLNFVGQVFLSNFRNVQHSPLLVYHLTLTPILI